VRSERRLGARLQRMRSAAGAGSMPFRVERNSHIHSLRQSPFPQAFPPAGRGESPSAVRDVGQKSLGRQPFGKGCAADGRVKAKPFGFPAGSLGPTIRPGRTGRLTLLRSTRNDEGPRGACRAGPSTCAGVLCDSESKPWDLETQ